MTLRRWTLAVTLALSAAPLLAEEAAPKADPLAGFGWLRDLAGSCWTAILPGGTLRDADSVRVSREKKDGEAWTESFAVVYTRVRP